MSPAPGPGTAPHLLVLKIGGSLVSDKRSGRALDPDAVADYARQVAGLARAYPGRLVLVSGGGAPGHAAVRSPDPADPHAVLGLTQATFSVKWEWVQALRNLGVPAMPIQVAALCSESEDGVRAETGTVRRLLDAGVVPVLSGDCILTLDGSLRVFGSDEVPSVLVGAGSGPVRVVTLTDVPGLLTGTGPLDGVLEYVDASDPDPAYALLWETAPWDTSGAMRGKLEALVAHARRGAECVIARGDRDAPGLEHLFAPLAAWPADVPRTVIAVPHPESGPAVPPAGIAVPV